MTDVGCFLDSRHGIEDVTTIDTLILIWVYREVTDTEGSEVLEEMSALARVYPIVSQTFLNDDTGS